MYYRDLKFRNRVALLRPRAGLAASCCMTASLIATRLQPRNCPFSSADALLRAVDLRGTCVRTCRPQSLIRLERLLERASDLSGYLICVCKQQADLRHLGWAQRVTISWHAGQPDAVGDLPIGLARRIVRYAMALEQE